jgi:hypothetical protein
MTAIFELHIRLPPISPSVGHRNDKERKFNQNFLKLCLDLSPTAIKGNSLRGFRNGKT